MSTSPEAAEFILEKVRDIKRFSIRRMFGEYALYADKKVVGLICDDQLYVKILPQSAALESVCEKASPYPGAKLYYLVEESRLSMIEDLAEMLIAIARSIPEKEENYSAIAPPVKPIC